jgi:hypothetical protein
MVSEDHVCRRGFCCCAPCDCTLKLLEVTPTFLRYSNFRVVSHHLRLYFFFAFLLLSTPLTRLGHLLGCERHPLHELFSFLLPSVERPVELHGMLRRQLLCHDRAYCGDGSVCGGQILGVDCKCMLQLQRRLLSRHRRTIIMLDLCSGACYLLCIRTIICRLILSRQELGRLIRKGRPYAIYT